VSRSDRADAAARSVSGRATMDPAARRPMLAVTATAAEARRAADRWSDVWAELKWDGVRAIGVWDGRRLRLYARSGTDVTARYPELTSVDAGLGPDPAVVDGEIVALDARGRPSFPRLQDRMHLTKPREIEAERARTPVRYYLYDVLADRGEDVAPLPLQERRALLERIAADAIPPIDIPPVLHDVDDALAMAERFGLEGVVVKNPSAHYRRGVRSEDWLKVKPVRTQEVVIGGIRQGQGDRAGIRSLLMGIPGPDGLQYAGRVGSGFSDAELTRIARELTPLRSDENPFRGVPALDARDAIWLRPERVGEVVYAERSDAGILRHARWRGLRPDKSPAEVAPEP
jgi:bifunctional non-homologous end joining protein LigD